MRSRRGCVQAVAVVLVFAGVLHSQEEREFEAVVVKRVTPNIRALRVEGGPGTKDPGRISFHNLTIPDFIVTANQLQQFQVIRPRWMDEERYDIDGTVPPGVTREEFRAMLQRLIVERFHLRYHRETRQGKIFALVVGKDGPKLNPPVETSSDPEFTVVGSTLHLVPHNEDIAWLVDKLAANLFRPVVDMTHLTGRYSYSLEFSLAGLRDASENTDVAGNLFKAIQEQIGLRLEVRTGDIDVMVIDSAEKAPIEK